MPQCNIAELMEKAHLTNDRYFNEYVRQEAEAATAVAATAAAAAAAAATAAERAENATPAAKRARTATANADAEVATGVRAQLEVVAGGEHARVRGGWVCPGSMLHVLAVDAGRQLVVLGRQRMRHGGKVTVVVNGRRSAQKNRSGRICGAFCQIFL